MIEESEGELGARFEVMFQPYGYGPEMSNSKQSMTIIVRASRISGEAGARFDPNGKNLMVLVDETNAEIVNAGGVYTGVLELVARGGRLGFELKDIEDRSTLEPPAG